MWKRRAAPPVLCLLLAACAAGAPRSSASAGAPPAVETGPLSGPLRPGPHAVGFTTRLTVDSTRGIAADSAGGAARGRPVKLLVWYPAQHGTGTAMRFGGYFADTVPDGLHAPYLRALAARDLDVARRQFSPASDSLRHATFALAVPARGGAEPAPGRAPLVIHVGGRNDYQQESTVLWEHLASHGYAVVVVPQFGASAAAPRVDFTRADMETQALDVLHAIRAAGALPFVDASRPALVGHSSGAVAGLLAAAREPSVAALVSLDGTTLTEDGVEMLAEETGLAGRVRIPIAEIHARGARGRSTALVDRLDGADRHLFGLGGGAPPTLATHFDFQNWPLYGAVLGVEDPRGAAARPTELGAAFHRTAIRLTRAFLDAAFADAPDAPLPHAGLALDGVEVDYRFVPAAR